MNNGRFWQGENEMATFSTIPPIFPAPKKVENLLLPRKNNMQGGFSAFSKISEI